ncbi:hypothetical protein QFZ81_000168 [Paenibacillus sp. V4I9]|uniref:hypothetical protein n=1 Tax=Paenibacillus sp. V4I9 TaxID=3042308 RepID=UPI002784E19C|nr:hypothetical protein [Paenibacillus sp. V4I9]MDQ0885080.1 hypothetical protein [Paenibacillus sp. V4I9]
MLVVADISPKIYEGDDEITYIISDEEVVVDHILDHNGIPIYVHLEESNKMTEEEFDAIWNDESDEED